MMQKPAYFMRIAPVVVKNNKIYNLSTAGLMKIGLAATGTNPGLTIDAASGPK